MNSETHIQTPSQLEIGLREYIGGSVLEIKQLYSDNPNKLNVLVKLDNSGLTMPAETQAEMIKGFLKSRLPFYISDVIVSIEHVNAD